MNKFLKHLLLPSFAPAAIVALYFTPKATFGCANRGLLALGIALIAVIVALVTTVKGVSHKRKGEKEASNWWLLTTLILLFSIALLFGPLA
jgi:hypothetical protein